MWLIFVLVILWTCVPGRVRVGLLDAVDPALPRRAGDHLPRRRVRDARPGGDDEGGARAGRAVRARLGADPVLPRRRDRRRGLGAGPGRQRGGRHVELVAQSDLGADRRDRRAHRRVPRGGVPGRRLGARGAAGARARVPRPGARLGRRHRAGGVGRAVRAALRRALAVRRADLRRRPRDGAGLRRRRRGHARAGVARALRRGAGDGGGRGGGDRGRLGARAEPLPAARPAHAREGRGRRRGPRRGPDLDGGRRADPGAVPVVALPAHPAGRLDQSYEPLDQRFRP